MGKRARNFRSSHRPGKNREGEGEKNHGKDNQTRNRRRGVLHRKGSLQAVRRLLEADSPRAVRRLQQAESPQAEGARFSKSV